MGSSSTRGTSIDPRFQNKLNWIKKEDPKLKLIEVGLVYKQPTKQKPGRSATKKMWIERRVQVDEQGDKKLYVTLNTYLVHQTFVFSCSH